MDMRHGTVWTASQGTYGKRKAFARFLGRPPARVRGRPVRTKMWLPKMTRIKRRPNSVVLYARGRDIEESETAMQCENETCRRSILGEASVVQLLLQSLGEVAIGSICLICLSD